MKKLLLTLIAIPAVMNAQVGIGTNNPLSDLHVAGTNSTIRIESQSAANYPQFNDGIKPAHAFVTDKGDVTINPSTNNGLGPNGSIAPINFLLTLQNFMPDGPLGRGTIINNNLLTTNASGLISTVPFTSPSTALIEVKYSITALLSRTDLNVALTPFNDISVRVIKFYFCIDINNDGLDAVELSKKYGLNAQAYSSGDQGILGYSYTNGHGYTTIPAGNHSLKFFAEINDGLTKFTSVGFGGEHDLLRIRIYN
ncbi:hypothetical protein [Flavobacterium pedocola]